jgi:hypothetical protein
MRKVDTKAVITVRMKLPILSAGIFWKSFIKLIFKLLNDIFLQGEPLPGKGVWWGERGEGFPPRQPVALALRERGGEFVPQCGMAAAASPTMWTRRRSLSSGVSEITGL